MKQDLTTNKEKPPFKLSVLLPVRNERFLVKESIEKVLCFRHSLIKEIELIVVDEGSTDGTFAIVEELALQHPNVILHPLPRSRGKGHAIRSAIQLATGQLTIFQDAALEYNPEDWARLLRPFFEANADAVFGSRFLSTDYRRVPFFKHSIGNRLLTSLSNLMTDLYLTDMQTYYKMVRTRLLQSIPLRSDDGSFDAELTAKLAKRGAAIHDVPIRYVGRDTLERKGFHWKDGMKSIKSILYWKLVDDIYGEDQYGSEILSSLQHVQKFNKWMAEVIQEHVGSRVLEIGAGLGSLTVHLIPRERYLATDINPDYLLYLQNQSLGKAYFGVQKLDLCDVDAFSRLREQFDTIICLNVLEHVQQNETALKNMYQALEPGGKAIILVPQGKWLYSVADEVLEHVKRYTMDELKQEVEDAGFQVVSTADYNKISVPAWFFNGKILRKKTFSSVQLKIVNTMTPVFKHLDQVVPWHGLSAIVVAQRPAKADSPP